MSCVAAFTGTKNSGLNRADSYNSMSAMEPT